jgi:hypothetical protein
MKKTSVLAVILIIFVSMTNSFAFAQDAPSVDITNSAGVDTPGDNAIQVGDPTTTSVGGGQTQTAGEGEEVAWNEDATGTANFLAGHIILVGEERVHFGLTEDYATELQFDRLGDSASSNTEVTLISGCFVVLVPASATNAFVVNFNNGASSVVITPGSNDTLVGICSQPDGSTLIKRIGGNGIIQVLRGDTVVVSNVPGEVAIAPNGNPILTPSGVGNASLF